MKGDTPSEATVRIVMEGGEPVLETRIRPIVPVADGPFQGGKILLLRTPMTPGLSEDEAWEATEQEFIDDDGSLEAFCPECAAGGLACETPWREPPPWMRPSPVGRNAPCPCGSGKKYKKCCLH